MSLSKGRYLSQSSPSYHLSVFIGLVLVDLRLGIQQGNGKIV